MQLKQTGDQTGENSALAVFKFSSYRSNGEIC